MIKNVNLMQNEADIIFDEQSGFSREHIIQALANLGQRIGIKGDSLSYKYFTFNDILTSSATYDPDKYIGFIEYFYDNSNNEYKSKFGVTNKLQLKNSNDELIQDTTININNMFVFSSDMSFDFVISGIEKYAQNSICINENNELTLMLAGKYIGYEDDDEYNTTLLYYKFNTLTNKLIEGYRLYHLNDDVICMNNIKDIDNEDDKDLYKLRIRTFDLNKNLNSLNKELFKNLFKFTNYKNSNLPFSIIKSKFKNIDLLKSYTSGEDNDIDYLITSNSIISIIENYNSINNNLTKIVQKELSVDLIYDSFKNELLATYNYDYVKDEALNEYSIDIDEDLYTINEDINKLYINIFKYYNKKYYLDTRVTFVKRILSKIYEKASNYNYSNGCRLYIPLNYNFHYICNSNDELNIYYSNNIYVTYTSLSKYNLETFWEANTNIVYDYNEIDKVKVYNFEISYNTYENDLINSIDIKEIYTMPYINAENNWSINNIDSKIQAIGKDAGNPNIIVIYSKTSESSNNKIGEQFIVLNSIAKKDIVNSSTYECKEFKVNRYLFNNSDEDYVCHAWIPIIDDYNKEAFSSSIIFSISDLACLDSNNAQLNYRGAYVYTLWYPTEVNGKLYFEYIKDTYAEYALSLGASKNILSESTESSSNTNIKDFLLLNANISDVAQETLSLNNYNYLVIKNQLSESYINELNYTNENLKYKSSDYNNDLNCIIQYNNDLNITNNQVIPKQKTNNGNTIKYIDNGFSNLYFTNKLYPIYSVSSETISENTTIPVTIEKLKSVDTFNTRILAQGQRVTNVDSLISSLKTVKEASSITVPKVGVKFNLETINKTNGCYNEYSFDSNVPIIDFKEVFNRNVNVLNRLNIISLDNKTHSLYNAYIGTSFSESDKSTLHIGSTNLNINIGTSTLMNESEKDDFSVHDTLSLDFNNIDLNASNHIYAEKNLTYKCNINGYTYISQMIKLIGSLINESIINIIDTSISPNVLNWSKSGLFAISNADASNPAYYISINQIFEEYFNIDISSNYNVFINNIEMSNENYLTNSDNIFENNEPKKILKLGATSENVYLFNVSNLYKLDTLLMYCPFNLDVMYYTYNSQVNGFNTKVLNIYLTLK